jgi:hypothetical protein
LGCVLQSLLLLLLLLPGCCGFRRCLNLLANICYTTPLTQGTITPCKPSLLLLVLLLPLLLLVLLLLALPLLLLLAMPLLLLWKLAAPDQHPLHFCICCWGQRRC